MGLYSCGAEINAMYNTNQSLMRARHEQECHARIGAVEINTDFEGVRLHLFKHVSTPNGRKQNALSMFELLVR